MTPRKKPKAVRMTDDSGVITMQDLVNAARLCMEQASMTGVPVVTYLGINEHNRRLFQSRDAKKKPSSHRKVKAEFPQSPDQMYWSKVAEGVLNRGPTKKPSPRRK